MGWLKYGEGFLDVAELAEMAIDLDVIEKGGAWYTLPGSDKKVQGFDSLCEALLADSVMYDQVTQQIKSVLS